MARKLEIKHKDRIGKTPFHFKDNNNRDITLGTLFGRNTTFPDWYYGITRTIDNKTWWIILITDIVHTGSQTIFTHIDENNKIIGEISTRTMPLENFTKKDQRALIRLTQNEAKKLGHACQPYGIAIREDSTAWDIFYGTKKHSNIPIHLPIKKIDNAITQYLEKQTEPKDTPIFNPITTPIKKLHNYTPVKVLHKINEIIDHLNND